MSLHFFSGTISWKGCLCSTELLCTFVRNQGAYVCGFLSGCGAIPLISAHTALTTERIDLESAFLVGVHSSNQQFESLAGSLYGISDLLNIYVCLHVLALVKHSLNICWMSEGFITFILSLRKSYNSLKIPWQGISDYKWVPQGRAYRPVVPLEVKYLDDDCGPSDHLLGQWWGTFGQARGSIPPCGCATLVDPVSRGLLSACFLCPCGHSGGLSDCGVWEAVMLCERPSASGHTHYPREVRPPPLLCCQHRFPGMWESFRTWRVAVCLSLAVGEGSLWISVDTVHIFLNANVVRAHISG